MIIKKGSSNRCGIFLYYDRQGKVDEYVIYLLNSIRPFLKNLLVVCNGEISEDAHARFNSVADEVMIRENEGFDVGGYRAGIFHIGLDKLSEYEETILFNYTFFGPLYPFQEMFDKMDDMDLDFWGITRHYKVDPDPYGTNRYGYMPEHIQSHFMTLRRDFINSKDYRDFITNLKNPTSYVESICEYETIFTKHFEDLGYKWDTYVDTSEYKEYCYCPIMFYLKDMIEKNRCPIIKRRSFFTDYNDFLLNTCGEPSVEAYDYIKKNLDYDLNMVWDNLLRLENMTEISKAMHLNFMIPANEAYETCGEQSVSVSVYVESAKHYERYIKYLNQIPQSMELYLIGTDEKLSAIPENFIGRKYKKCIIDKNDYITAYKKFESYIKDYDIAGILVMADVEVEKPYSSYDSWQYGDWENLLGTECIIRNIVSVFSENERLGMLVPPEPDYGILFEKRADGWYNSFDEVAEYLKANDCNVSCKIDEPPAAPFGGSFFIRTKAFCDYLKEDEEPDKNILLMAQVYMVQKQGYYTGVCYNNEYAAIETTNLDYMMRELNKVVFEKYGPSYHKVVVDRINNDQIIRNTLLEGRKQKIKRMIIRILHKIMPDKLYIKARARYMKMRGWE